MSTDEPQPTDGRQHPGDDRAGEPAASAAGTPAAGAVPADHTVPAEPAVLETSDEDRAGQPSLVPGTVLLGIAAILIVVVLVKPDMPDWLRTGIAIVAVLVVITLLVIAFRVFRGASRRYR